MVLQPTDKKEISLFICDWLRT